MEAKLLKQYIAKGDCRLVQHKEIFSQAFPVMEEIRRQGLLCDVVLKVDDQSFSAHKIVLASTIPYFRAMFTHDMVEMNQGEIKMQGIEAIALESLINFAYSGVLVLSKDNIQSIMVGASFLQLNAVIEACSDFLKKSFHAENILAIRQFADTMGCRDLTESSNKYIVQNFHEVSQSEDYLNLPVEEITQLLQSNDLNIESEEPVFEACMRWVKHCDARHSHLPGLLAQVRLPMLSPLYLTDRVATEELIRTSLQCRDLLDEARVYHLIPERRSLLQSFRTTPRNGDVAAGHIFVVGGLNRNGESLDTVECLDPVSGEWSIAPRMLMLRSRLGVAVLREKLYACGGYNGFERLCTVEMFDPYKKEWARVNRMHHKRSAVGAAVVRDAIYVCGGYDGIQSLNSVEKYCPLTDTWTYLRPMFKSRSAGAVVACQGSIYALGGHDGMSIFDSVEKYDPQTNKWSEVAPMLTKRCRLGVATLNGEIYVCGGYDGTSFLDTVEVYTPSTNKWRFLSSMNVQRSRVALTSNVGKLWAVGGYDGLSNLTSVEVYDPATDAWSFAAPMSAHEGGVGVGVLPFAPAAPAGRTCDIKAI